MPRGAYGHSDELRGRNLGQERAGINVRATLELGFGGRQNSTPFSLQAGTWTRLSVTFENSTRGTEPLSARLLLAPNVGVAATVWVDDASVVQRDK